jgi:hypothetical protein
MPGQCLQPQAAGTNYAIKITSISSKAYSGSSDGYFTISPAPLPTIQLITPNGGEVQEAGTTQTVAWSYTGNPGAYLKIQLYKNGVLSRTLTTSARTGNGGSGSYSWPISLTQTTGSNYKICVTSTSNARYTDMSDNYFSISGPVISVTLTSPNTAQTWKTGASNTITWSYQGNPGSKVRIELLKGGVLDRTISYSAPVGSAGQGSYKWVIPASQPAGSSYKIRIVSTSNSAYLDSSDSDFTISR